MVYTVASAERVSIRSSITSLAAEQLNKTRPMLSHSPRQRKMINRNNLNWFSLFHLSKYTLNRQQRCMHRRVKEMCCVCFSFLLFSISFLFITVIRSLPSVWLTASTSHKSSLEGPRRQATFLNSLECQAFPSWLVVSRAIRSSRLAKRDDKGRRWIRHREKVESCFHQIIEKICAVICNLSFYGWWPEVGDRSRLVERNTFYSSSSSTTAVNPKSAYHICVIKKTFGNIEKPHKERWRCRRHKRERCCTIIAIALFMLLIQFFSVSFIVCLFLHCAMLAVEQRRYCVFVDNFERKTSFQVLQAQRASSPLLSLNFLLFFNLDLLFDSFYSWRKQHYHLQYREKKMLNNSEVIDETPKLLCVAKCAARGEWIKTSKKPASSSPTGNWRGEKREKRNNKNSKWNLSRWRRQRLRLSVELVLWNHGWCVQCCLWSINRMLNVCQCRKRNISSSFVVSLSMNHQLLFQLSFTSLSLLFLELFVVAFRLSSPLRCRFEVEQFHSH